MIYTSHYTSPLGRILLAGDGTGLSGLWFEGQKYFAANLPGTAEENDSLPIFKNVRHWLDVYFSGSEPDFTPPLNPIGSPFRHAVWEIMCGIPYGQTVTYGGIAQSLAARGIHTSARAVGNAVGHNPISLIIPCHRVVGAGGRLTGYAGGIDKKIYLLRLEGVCASQKGIKFP